MDLAQAKQFIEREKSRSYFPSPKGSEVEFMWSRERLYNGLTMLCALFGVVFAFLGRGWNLLVIILAVIAARQIHKQADACRQAREAIEGNPAQPS